MRISSTFKLSTCMLDCRVKYVAEMPTPLITIIFALSLALQSVPTASQFAKSSIPIAYEATVIVSSDGVCPTAEERQEAQDEIRLDVRKMLDQNTCGGIGWNRIVYLNMSDSSHQCPGDFREVTFEGKRLCARDSTADTSRLVCTSTTFSSNGIPYSAVCGRVVGYQYGVGLAFGINTNSGPKTIDEYYVDGLILTHGPVGAREHIWTFATGLEEILDLSFNAVYTCPCAVNASSSIVVPPFVGEDYFCESGVVDRPYHIIRFHDDPLWDGDGCVKGNSCCTLNGPPYFTKQLPASTSDDIELRDCGSWYSMTTSSRHGDTLIQFIELYVK